MADETNQPRNRKERRAAARANGEKPSASSSGTSTSTRQHLDQSHLDIPMAVPDFTKRQSKTLLDIAEERMKQLNGKPIESLEGEEVEWPMSPNDDLDFGPAAEAVLYAFSLGVTHFTFAVLCHHQYREEIVWGEVFQQSLPVFPILWLVVYLFHTQTAKKLGIVREVIFFGASIAAGCYSLYIGNTYGYFAVMKQAPPVGTLWIWCVVEMQVYWAMVSMVAVAGYALWNGYTLF
ncbi:uncharacterized protein J3D65DRAFT_617591 [Phyllosticta citribraziliensis]|uniref:DUF7719 domain-containing protein n=1 Tax=Phyllosticta citribraziliensis TaxID=989973 RepID=A0ABR1M110_9PEZI